MNKKNKIVVGMSGGVDSSMALVLLKEQGWDPVGVSLKYKTWEDPSNAMRENVCCSIESFDIAKGICEKLGVEYHQVDVQDNFQKETIDYFTSELKEKRTPNPCIVCNRRLKFRELFDWADAHGIDYVATGHYGRVKKNPETGKFELLRAKDDTKDQTYSLCQLPQEWLERVVLPIGNYTKDEIMKSADKLGFDIFTKRAQSQDFCFVSGTAYPKFLEKEIGNEPGEIQDIEGKTLGKHPGLHFFTVGQRKGMDLPGGPYYVVRLDSKRNVLVVSDDIDDVKGTQMQLSKCHFISGEVPLEPIPEITASVSS